MLQIGGVIFFALAVFVTILFAEGYQYDSVARDIVKKSVILFEKLPKGASVTVDGKPTPFALSGELRVVPGTYFVTVSVTGFSSWKTHISVLEDTVVRFPEIRLISSVRSHMIEDMSYSMKLWRFRSASEEGVLLENPNLHFGKFFPFPSPLQPKVIEFHGDRPMEDIPAVDEKSIENRQPIRWFSQIGSTYHFLFLTGQGDLQFCDEDGENCTLLVSDPSLPSFTSMIAASQDRLIFMMPLKGFFTWFDFGEDDGGLPSLLKDLISAIF
jgi:hypothetical protein